MTPNVRGKRVAILGVGNEMKGDDAAGLLAVRLLKNKLAAGGLRFLENPVREKIEYSSGSIFLIEAGLAPENFSGPLRKFQPDMVIMIDAADMEREVGASAWFSWDKVSGFSGSTHLLPLSIFASFLVNELKCDVFVVGIQPASLIFGESASRKVRLASKTIANEIYKQLG